MKKIILSVLVLFVAIAAQAQVQRPKIVVGLVVDQMRWDYLYYYYDKYGQGGLRRVLAEGFSCDNQMLDYVPTVTGVGHASIYTGASPAYNGIAANNFHIDGKQVYCCEDQTVQGVGTSSYMGHRSPANMLGTTIGDMLRAATGFKSKVVGVALKDRAAILPAGHSANAAYWYDPDVAGYITSTYYTDRLPQWVVKFNKEQGKKKGYDPKGHADGVTLTFDMAEAAIKNEQLGQGDATDMLCVSVSSTDAISHTTGTWLSPGKENEEAFLTLDRDLAKFLTSLDSQFGKDGYLLFLTADHGGTHNANTLGEHHLPGGGWDSQATLRQLNEALKAQFGTGADLVQEVIGYELYLDHEAISKAGLDIDKVKDATVKIMRRDSQFQFVADFENVGTSGMPQRLRERVLNGYYPGRSGDIIAICKPNVVDHKVEKGKFGSDHGSWSAADTHIPLIFMGWNVKHGHTNRPTFMTDTAPTVCSMLHIQMPDACSGNAITELTDCGQ